MESIDNTIIFDIIRKKRIITEGGVEKTLHSHIDVNEGLFLQKIIMDNADIVRSLEVGCAYGIASMFICNALKKRKGVQHTIVDPKQSVNWRKGGIFNLKKINIDFFELIEEESQIVLPRLLADGQKYDFIFIDGLHTFDATLIDLYYAVRLLRKGGVVVVDDCFMPSVAKAIKYMSQWPNLEIVGIVGGEKRSFKRRVVQKISDIIPNKIAKYILPMWIMDRLYSLGTMVALKKKSEDMRSWNWYVEF